MDKSIQFTLITDGSSDRVLVAILEWLLKQHIHQYAINGLQADFREFQSPPQSLIERIRQSIDLFPCNLLFVHRDAESQSIDDRVQEVLGALASVPIEDLPIVCVVPIRMQEAWLLIDEQALRFAAGNPNGSQPLHLPDVAHLERLPDPKQILHDKLKTASGLSGRRLDRFNPRREAHRIVDYIEDFSILRRLSAFNRLEDDLKQVINEIGWK